MLGRSLKIPDNAILRHYHNRGFLPFEIAQDLKQAERDQVKSALSGALSLKPIYLRIYPNDNVAGQIVGYVGKTSRNADGIIQNGQVLWPETEGREGLEQTFNSMLTGRHGHYKVTFDRDGKKTSERVIDPPVPGYNVVTTLDLHLQEMAEKSLAAKAKRGAIVIIDPNNGDILAMASYPSYNPNDFVPSISAAKFKELQNDPDIPLLPRAYRSAYPPGSTFKVAVGIAALETGAITAEDEYRMRAGDGGREHHFSQLETYRSGLAQLRPGADAIVRHLVLSGRDQDRRGADYGLGGAARFRRKVRRAVEGRSGRPAA